MHGITRDEMSARGLKAPRSISIDRMEWKFIKILFHIVKMHKYKQTRGIEINNKLWTINFTQIFPFDNFQMNLSNSYTSICVIIKSDIRQME